MSDLSTRLQSLNSSRVTSVTDGKNQKTSYGYTNLNQIETVTYADSSTITYSYDQDNNLISQIDHTGTTKLHL